MKDEIAISEYISYIQKQLESVYETLKMIQNTKEEDMIKIKENINSIKKILTNQIGMLVFCVEELEKIKDEYKK